MKNASALRTAYLVAACWIFFKWLTGDFSSTGLIVVAILSLSLGVLAWVAKQFPLLGKAIGLMFILAPAFAWWHGVYDANHFRSDGSPAGFIIMVLLIALSLASVWLGFTLIAVAKDTTEYSDADKVEVIRRAIGGD